ncbi:hypothetical protein BD626DRAFT_571256 [Schizophyllum amplum]|uniref:Uncharacterized protein n=1 Tax=Schizophyllum amplum TaxID=97359 RepID=A0A550C845_9AGAR|nr:hypothetical protein BD626DRAFT_571256 [Auriculariopsis ampla]
MAAREERDRRVGPGTAPPRDPSSRLVLDLHGRFLNVVHVAAAAPAAFSLYFNMFGLCYLRSALAAREVEYAFEDVDGVDAVDVDMHRAVVAPDASAFARRAVGNTVLRPASLSASGSFSIALKLPYVRQPSPSPAPRAFVASPSRPRPRRHVTHALITSPAASPTLPSPCPRRPDRNTSPASPHTPIYPIQAEGVRGEIPRSK